MDGGGWQLLLTLTEAQQQYAGSVSPFLNDLNATKPSVTNPYSRDWTGIVDPTSGDQILIQNAVGEYVKFIVTEWCGWDDFGLDLYRWTGRRTRNGARRRVRLGGRRASGRALLQRMRADRRVLLVWMRRRRDRVVAQRVERHEQPERVRCGVGGWGGGRGASSAGTARRRGQTLHVLVPAEFRTDAGALAGPNRHPGSVRTAHARSEPATQRAAVRHASPDHHSAADERAIPNADVSTHLHRAAHDRADGNNGADAGS